MANPETCYHNIVGARVTEDLELAIDCLSCGTDVSSPEKRVGKNYKKDPNPNHDIWVHVPGKRVKRE